MPEGADRSAQALRFLEDTGIAFHLVRHEPVSTIAQCLSHPEISRSGVMPRNLFLCNRQQTEFWLLLLSPLRPFRTAVVSKLLEASRLSFAPEALLPDMLGLTSGAVSPLGLLFDREHRVRLAMDADLLKAQYLWFHPCVNDASLRLRTDDFRRRFLPALGREAQLLQLSA